MPVPTTETINSHLQGFIRPQVEVDDLFAEYEAWVAGNLDGHDKVVATYRERIAANSDAAHELALRFLTPDFVCSHGKCDCRSKTSVVVQLEGRLAVLRSRRLEYEQREASLEKRIAFHKKIYEASLEAK